MHRMSASACIDAPAPVVWDYLARLDAIHLWTDLIHLSRVEGACHRGVGAERVCALGAGRSNRELAIAWDEGHSYTYVSFDAPMMREARNTWSVTPMGDRTSSAPTPRSCSGAGGSARRSATCWSRASVSSSPTRS